MPEAQSAPLMQLFTPMRACRDSLQRARLARVRETHDDVQVRRFEVELDQLLTLRAPAAS